MLSMVSLAVLPAMAQQFPAKPIKIIVGFGPGGTADSVARLYGQKISELLGTPVIVDNKPGGNQVMAIRTLMSSPPDGYTLFAATGSALVQNPALRANLPYDPLKDFSLIGLAVTNPGVVIVSPDLPVKSMSELVAYAAANPGKLNYGSAGIGTAGHLAVEALMNATGTKLNHIPYKSDTDVIREIMGGNVQLAIFTTLNTVSFINSGKIRALAVTSPRRLPYLPNVPSIAETDVKGLSSLDPNTFISFVGPAGMPAPVVARLNEAVNKASSSPDIAARVRNSFYAEPATTTPATFRDFVEAELAKWRTVGKTVKLPD